MPANREHPPLEADPSRDLSARIVTLIAWLTVAGTLIVPLAVAPDLLDRFRVLKESILRAQGIAGLLLVVVAGAVGGTKRFRAMLRERMLVAAVAAGWSWILLTTFLSTHRAWSYDSLVSATTSLLVFVAAWYAAERVSLVILDLLVPAILINTLLVAAQEYGLYQPFTVDPNSYRHLTATGFIGNPNIVGTYMALVAIVLATATVRVHGWRRWLYGCGAFCAIAGVFVSRTRTAVIALLVGLVVLAFALSFKRALLFAGLVTMLFCAGYLTGVRAIRRVVALPSNIASVGWEVASSGRMTPALVAMEMFREHPATGIGPGAFQPAYMPYQIRVREQYGQRVSAAGATSFGETHNDHLQLLAETGLIGYLLFIGALAALVITVRRTVPASPRHEVAHSLILPLLATFFVLALAQFPLHLAVTRQLLMTMAGLAVGWSRR